MIDDNNFFFFIVKYVFARVAKVPLVSMVLRVFNFGKQIFRSSDYITFSAFLLIQIFSPGWCHDF